MLDELELGRLGYGRRGLLLRLEAETRAVQRGQTASGKGENRRAGNPPPHMAIAMIRAAVRGVERRPTVTPWMISL